MKFKKTYKFAFWSAFYIFCIFFVIDVIFYFLLENNSNFIAFLLTTVVLFFICFFIIQIRAERFIYNRIKKIYDEFSVFGIEEINKSDISTDIEQLSQSMQDYVKDKRIEIQNLTERDSFRRDFLGNVSHELKTPLFTVQGYILTLIEGAKNDKLIRDKYLDRANKGVERLVSIVKDLDMIAKLETEGMKMNIEVFNIVELIQNVFDLFEMRAKKRNITLTFDKVYDVPIFVKGDVERIEQVLINLIVNSIKYGRTGGISTVGIESFDDQKITVKVSDNGEGIKKEHLGRLFERFFRVDKSRSRDQGGSGLGLSIVKHIVEAHGETISVKSTYGEGSEFSFTLEKVK